LDIEPGKKFIPGARSKFHSTIHPLGKSNHFLLLVSFAHSKFRLDSVSVGLVLEACLGGSSEDFSVISCGQRTFRFSVASRNVGFMVYQLHYFSCAAFKFFFHPWGNGGANWRKEFRVWQTKFQQEWTLVSPNKRQTDQALLALRRRPAKSILRTQPKNLEVNWRLSFATIEAYPICHGYEFPATDEKITNFIQAGYMCPQLQRRYGVIFAPSIVQSDL
jgi:hypothetical protein